MKQLLQSMTTRIFLVLLAGVTGATILTFGLSLAERQRMVGQFRDYHAVERIGLHAEHAVGTEPVSDQRSPLAVMLDRRLPDHQVLSTPSLETDCPVSPRRARQQAPERLAERRQACEALLVTLSDGEKLRLSVLPPRPPSFGLRPNLLHYGLFLLSIAVLAAIIARMALRPLKRLAQAATELGRDIERPPVPERGALEIRQAAAAFNAMQARIRHHIRQRGEILAAITHDLQTPLTRMRLRLEKVEDAELRAKLIDDLFAMQGMVKEGLELARSMDSAETPQLLDLDSLIDSVCIDAADAGQDVAASAQTGLSLRARPLALRRCLTNLIDNAVKYGGSARVSAANEAGYAVIRIRDAGPGIPPGELDKVFEPFYRVESSRSRETGGTGLGLAIARNIAEQHGGTIALRNHPEGGIEATLRLPLQASASGK